MSLPGLIVAMLRPEFYPHHPVQVTLVQSHISYVLLAGDEVYKVKKPVRFSFLDFSSLELRRHFCHEEVRLNRRLAAEVYLGVVAICGDGASYWLGREDDRQAVEYAVHMRRVPDDRILARLLDQKRATPAMIEAIAVRLADFHRVAEAGPAVIANGDPAAIGRVLADNYAGMRPFRDVIVSGCDDDAIQAFTADFLARHAGLFRQRQAEQRIRECHGDLHAEHICFVDGLAIFDCIEFNEQFRYCDVASEIAFLAMDLDYHEQPELAAHLVARYAAVAADVDLPRLVPFYQCYRAYVRGKVDSLKSAETEVADSERATARESARRHVALAYRYTWAYRPCLVAVAGLSGTGKSVVAAALHARTGYRHLNADVIRKELAGLPAASRQPVGYDRGLYAPEHRAATYQAMLVRAEETVAARRGAILDATFQRRADRDALRALATRHGVALLFVECRCDEAEIRRRLQQRAGTREGPSDADWTVYVEQRRRYEPFGPDETADRLVVDSTVRCDDLTAAIERELRARMRTLHT